MAQMHGVGFVGAIALTTMMALGSGGCSSNTGEAEVAEWGGSQPHLRVAGTYKGEEVDLAIQDQAATDIANFSCMRHYQAPVAANGQLDLAQAKFREFKLIGFVSVKGERRAFEIEFKRQNFGSSIPGATFAVIPRNDEELPGPSQFWFEWEWHDANTGDTLDERAAQEGSFTLGELTGTPDANGIIPDNTGSVGGFISAKWSESESVRLSFTAKCAKNEIESDE